MRTWIVKDAIISILSGWWFVNIVFDCWLSGLPVFEGELADICCCGKWMLFLPMRSNIINKTGFKKPESALNELSTTESAKSLSVPLERHSRKRAKCERNMSGMTNDWTICTRWPKFGVAVDAEAAAASKCGLCCMSLMLSEIQFESGANWITDESDDRSGFGSGSSSLYSSS